MIGVGSWLETEEQSIVSAIESRTFLYGPYLIIAAGVAVVLLSVIGLLGAISDKMYNRVFLVVVRGHHINKP